MSREPPVTELLYRRFTAILQDNCSPCSALEQKGVGCVLGGGGEGGLGRRS